MKLIVGLGNPGKEYERNRHNVGFMLVDYLVQTISKQNNIEVTWKEEAKWHAQLTKITAKNEELLFVKPQTFMNRSGETVGKVISFYKIATTDLYVAHDDLDIPLGKCKVQLGTGPKLHNGIDSIEETLGTKDFYRIRIGVENRTGENRMPGEAYVLQDFSKEEKKTVSTVFAIIEKRLSFFHAR